MEVNRAIKTIEKIAPDAERIFQDEEATGNLATWLNGYITRARLEERRKGESKKEKGGTE